MRTQQPTSSGEPQPPTTNDRETFWVTTYACPARLRAPLTWLGLAAIAFAVWFAQSIASKPGELWLGLLAIGVVLPFGLTMIWRQERVHVSLQDERLWLRCQAILGRDERLVPEGRLLLRGPCIVTEAGKLVWCSESASRPATRDKVAASVFRLMCVLKPSIQDTDNTPLSHAIQTWKEAGEPGEFSALQSEIVDDRFELSDQRPAWLRRAGAVAGFTGVGLICAWQWHATWSVEFSGLQRWASAAFLSGLGSTFWVVPFLVLSVGDKWTLTVEDGVVRICSESGKNRWVRKSDLPFVEGRLGIGAAGHAVVGSAHRRRLEGAILILLMSEEQQQRDV